jgi:hypothetical protein
MKTFIAEWPNGTISILTANSVMDALERLEREGDVGELGKLYQCPTDFHISTDLEMNGNEVKIELGDVKEIGKASFAPIDLTNIFKSV